MKKILIVIHDMRIGGAQKSLLSFLQCLEAHEERSIYEIHLLALHPVGEFLAQLPADVILEQPHNAVCWMSMPLRKQLLLKRFSWRGMAGEGMWLLRKTLRLFPRGLNNLQCLWRNWKAFIPRRPEKYDTAIAYIDGVASYYVMDCVQADKKVLWLHNDYGKLKYAPEYDAPYYSACDQVITISEECRDSVVRCHPAHADKIHILPNMTSCQAVLDSSRRGSCPEYPENCGIKLLTVGRLNEQKGIDLAVQAAKILRDAGQAFCWLVVGEGGERAKLEREIQLAGLENYFLLIGARMNPYAYMRECDILVQPSRFEGKSIVLDEAKMLSKPIVATNYSTVQDALIHGQTGWVVEMNPEAIAQGILVLCHDSALRKQLSEKLDSMPKGNTAETQRYIDLMF